MGKTHFSIRLMHPRFWFTWIGIILWWLLVQILPFRAQMWIGGKLGRLAGLFSERRRIIALKNIEMCFPELSKEEQQNLMWANMESTGRGFFDTGIAWFWPAWRLAKVTEVHGVQKILDAFDREEGVLLFTFHFTSLEPGIAALNSQYPHMNYGVYRPHRNLVYDYFQRKGRERHSPDLEAIPRKDVRAMVRALRKGRMMIYLPDQDYGTKYSVFVPFFGNQAATVSAPSQLAKMGRAKVYAVVPVRKPDNSGYLATVYEGFESYGKGDEVADAELLNRFIEDRVREHPDQYLWTHRRFKSQEDGSEDFYNLNRLKSFQRRNKRRAKAWAAKQAKKPSK